MSNGLNFLTYEQVNQYVDSKKWWKIVGFDSFSNKVMMEIENKYYMNGNNQDFQLCLISPPGAFMGLAFAHKRHMSLNQLNRLLRSLGMPKNAEIPSPNHDILFPCRRGDVETAKKAAMMLDKELSS
ncbi:hypothetical protein ABRT01_03610 [Lentibacillus sp. L22]|uniref:hypothetical protein n=1 Tax=Lentibacillus sp. L22 TaxID=3163028 RepID=UPI003467CA49